MVMGLDYAGACGRQRVRAGAGVADWMFVAVVAAAYVTAGYGRWVMPGGYGWDAEWERANFLYNVAAGAGGVCFVAGGLAVLRRGWRRCSWAVVVGMVAAGVLPVVMLVLAKRWMQGNFA